MTRFPYHSLRYISLKYTTRPGGSEPKFRNADASFKPLTAFNFTTSVVPIANVYEDENRNEQEHEMTQLELQEALNDGEDESSLEDDPCGSESPVNIRTLLD
ncbi:hypothetical protein V1508DRAFT_399835 [Lipomyces doorenjongii]|uniref:uncharacterized protein n=1 Tax=Lipomyces doorenjongii TaxID=383834 RepID=UPI0034CEBD2C